MKLNRFSQQNTQGSVLLVTLAIALLFGGILVAYMVMVTNNQKATVRAETWNRALPLAEAGVEEAMAHLNRNFLTNNMTIAGWALNGTNWSAHRDMADGYYNVSVSDSTNAVIYATGGAAMPMDGISLERTIRVQTILTNIVQYAIATREDIKANGNVFSTDSYDSSDPLHSGPAGKYDPAKAKDRGDVATNLGTEGGLDVGNANVKGKVHTGPNGTVATGPNASVGSAGWVTAGTPGIESGYSSDDMNVPFPKVEPPFTTGTTPTGANFGTNSFDFVLGSANYVVSNFRGKVLVVGHAVLLVTDRCQFSGQDCIRIAPGASLTMYVACADASIGGQGVINQSTPTAFSYMGLDSNTSLSIAGNGQLSGFIYAPNADISLNGGGQVYGSIMGKSLSMNGAFSFHFDEALSNYFHIWCFLITSWDEV